VGAIIRVGGGGEIDNRAVEAAVWAGQAWVNGISSDHVTGEG
jgi:hypothetical protein